MQHPVLAECVVVDVEGCGEGDGEEVTHGHAQQHSVGRRGHRGSGHGDDDDDDGDDDSDDGKIKDFDLQRSQDYG